MEGTSKTKYWYKVKQNNKNNSGSAEIERKVEYGRKLSTQLDTAIKHPATIPSR
jgi:hypothetical protein